MPAYFPATAAITATANVDWGTLYLANATGGAITLTLPPVATGRAPIWLKKTDSSGNAVKFVTADSSTIDGGSGATGVSTTTQNAVIRVICDGTNWFTV